MDIKYIQTFVTAAKYENFRQTSEMLFISQPTVSLHIKNLESELQTALFYKKGRNVFLTQEGQLFLPFAEKMLDTYTHGIDKIRSFEQGFERKLTIAVAPYIAATILPPFLKNYFLSNKDIDITVNVVKSTLIEEELLNKKADIGISRMKPKQMDLICERLSEDKLILIGPREADGRQITEEECFKKYKLLTSNNPDYSEDLLYKVRHRYPHLRTMIVTQVSITRLFIIQGLGVSFLPRMSVYKLLENEKVVNIPFKNLDLPNASTYFVTKKQSEDIIQFKHTLKTFIKKI